MAIISIKFLFFVLVSLIIFYLVPGKLQNLILILASYYFYSTWAWWFALILLILTIFNYFFAPIIQQAKLHRRLLLWFGVGFNSTLYLIFLVANLFNKQITGLASSIGLTLAILIPVGLGYRVMECISYLFDTNVKIIRPTKNFLDFALYLAFFPKLIAGPIERARSFLPQITVKKEVNKEVITRSILLILIGLVQAVILAGLLSVLTPISPLKRPQDHTNIELLLGLLGFAFTLFTQFAGYTNIVRGISGFFGIELSRNFAYPIFSKDFSDFWKRWHISLSQWLRDYVFMPISRSFLRRNPTRSNKPNLFIPPLITMLISGIWHGGSPNLLVWGVLNGLYIVFENIRSLYRPANPAAKIPWYRKLFSSMVVFSMALIAGIPFSMSLATSKVFLYQMIFSWPTQIPDLRPLVIMAVILLIEWIQYRHDDEFIFLKWPNWIQSLAAATIILGVIIVSTLQSVPPPFIYP